MGDVSGSPRGVMANAARSQIGPELAREVARPDVVGGDHERRPAPKRLGVVDQRREQVRADGRRHVYGRRPAIAYSPSQRAKSLVVGGDVEQRAKAHRRG
jgi:hypothetical protein